MRIVREVVTSATRHGRAVHITVQLTGTGERVLRVSDDGIGFDPDKIDRSAGFGLVSMRERAEALGATFAIRLREGPGDNGRDRMARDSVAPAVKGSVSWCRYRSRFRLRPAPSDG